MKTKVVCFDKQNPQEPSDLKSDLAIGVKVTGFEFTFANTDCKYLQAQCQEGGRTGAPGPPAV